jgi:anti-sigma factor RsiW
MEIDEDPIHPSEKYEVMVAKHLDGVLTPEEERELSAELERDPTLKKYMEQLSVLQVKLREMGDDWHERRHGRSSRH